MKNYWETNNEPHANISLTKSEVNTIINSTTFVLAQKDVKLSDGAKLWYEHIKNLFESFKKNNY